MNNLAISIICVLLIIMLFMYERMMLWRRTEIMREKVSWCVTDLYESRESFFWFINEFAPEGYVIQKNEMDNFYIILDEYRKDLAEWFLRWNIQSQWAFPKRLVSLRSKDFFIVTFQEFLDRKSCVREFAGAQMYRHIEDVNSYTKKYEMTDFAVTYHKAYLAASCFKKSNKMLSPNLDSIKESINKKETEIMYYIP